MAFIALAQSKINFDSFYQISDGNKLYSVVVSGDTRSVSITYGSLHSKSFKDIILNEQNDEFVREFTDGMRINYAGGVQTILVKKERAGVFMETVKKDKSYKFVAITMDLETRQIKTSSGYVLEVISIAYYNGGVAQTYFCMDYDSSEAMIQKAIEDLFMKFSNSTIYIQKLSGFDGMFLLKALANYSDKFKIVKKEDKIISLSVTKARIFRDDTKYVNTLTFKDSLLLLPASLKSLGNGFSFTNKGDFDHSLTCDISDSDLLYLREDLLKYNLQDCIVLYEVLEKFSVLIFDMFGINIGDTPTVSSLALRIYRSNFMDSNSRISISDTNMYSKLHGAYYGGAVDVFIPQSDHSEKVYCYDLNSLYPAVMLQNDFPVGAPRFVEGAIDLHAKDTFGFLKVNVTRPTDLNMPLLMTKLDGRTVAPLGSWTGWYFTEELKLAATLGYKLEVVEGVLYERRKIFARYVETLYTMRLSFDKADPRNLICKLLLNSLYGKFGMSPYLSTWKLVDQDINCIEKEKGLCEDIIELGDKWILSYPSIKNTVVQPPKSEAEALQIIADKYNLGVSEVIQALATDKNLNRTFGALTKGGGHLNISLPIAAAVTAYARCNIYEYKKHVVGAGGNGSDQRRVVNV